MRKIVAYFNLCRLDALLIAFFSYMVGAELGGKIGFIDIVAASAVSLISTNFIYSFNSWTDREIDRIGKPFRPIPSGRINQVNALRYSLVLLCLSIIYPFIIFSSWSCIVLALMLPVLGIIYSAEPIRLRRFPIIASIVICSGLVIPISLGYFVHASAPSLLPFLILLYLFCICLVPLKQAEEVEEDEKTGSMNLYSIYGLGLLIYSLCGLLLLLLATRVILLPFALKAFLTISSISSIGCILIFVIFKKDMARLYQTIINIIVFEGAMFYIALNLV